MKRLLIAFFILLYVFSSTGCDSKTNSLSKGQKIAVKNSIKYIKASFPSKKRINTKIVKIENVTEVTRKIVKNNNTRVEEDKIDLTDWVITIGDTSGANHNFSNIVCDSSTFEVIGYIPVD